MSKPKRHHFVPQFYLRRFSNDGRSVICFHKASRRIIPTAPIKGQCAIDNFYAWDDAIEPSLGVIEGYAAQVLRHITATSSLPPLSSADWHGLLMFVALQSSRTQLSGRESDDMADYYYKLMAQGRPELKDVDLSKIRIGAKFPAALPMEIAIQAYPTFQELTPALLVNRSRFPFITSDNPVLFYNSQRAHIQHQGVIGMSSQGLQIVYPIDPRFAIYLYDASVYQRPSNTDFRLIREDDAIKINLALYMWSGEAVYISQLRLSDFVSRIADLSGPYLPFARSVNRESEAIPTDDDHLSAILHSYRTHAPLEVDFSFARHTKTFPMGGTWIRGLEEQKFKDGADVRSYRFGKIPDRPQLRGGELNRAIRNLMKTTV